MRVSLTAAAHRAYRILVEDGITGDDFIRRVKRERATIDIEESGYRAGVVAIERNRHVDSVTRRANHRWGGYRKMLA